MKFWPTTIEINPYFVCDGFVVRDYLTKSRVFNAIILVFRQVHEVRKSLTKLLWGVCVFVIIFVIKHNVILLVVSMNKL